MDGLLPQLGLLGLLVLLNAVFAGSEIALISLREGQLQRLERRSRTGAVLARLARDPNRFLATIQIGITLAGFLASAFAAVTLAEPLVPALAVLGSAAEPIAIVTVTLILMFVTLVLGELAPKRVAMQRAERWGLIMAHPLSLLAQINRPLIWLLGRSTDVVVRLMGADPSLHREHVTEQELRDLVATQTAFSEQQRTIISGAFEIGERTLRQVLVSRGEVFCLPSDMAAPEALALLMESGHTRAPVVAEDLDNVGGLINLRALFGAEGRVADHVDEVMAMPESVKVVDALRRLQRGRQQMALVVDEHGGGAGIVTVEDLIEELVGEIYDETDSDIESVVTNPDGSVLIPGTFPAHDLADLQVDLPPGAYSTAAGVILDSLGYLPRHRGATVEVAGRTLEVVEVSGRSITRIRVHPPTIARDTDGRINGPDTRTR